MGKYSRRRYQREYKRAGFPFLLTVKLARAREKFLSAWEMVEFLGPEFGVEIMTYCECCGPEAIQITHGEKQFTVSLCLIPR